MKKINECVTLETIPNCIEYKVYNECLKCEDYYYLVTNAVGS